MGDRDHASTALAAAVTRRASTQSYLTIRWLADAGYQADAFALYAYFRWLDDEVDERLTGRADRLALLARQRGILAAAQAGPGGGDGPDGVLPPDTTPQERLLVRLARRASAAADDGEAGEGLRTALGAMLDVLEFDAGRRGRPVTQADLDGYSRDLAVAVTETIHHCVGHGCRAPRDETRYVAVVGAHVAHMLRDLAEDLAAGYLNVPCDVVPDLPRTLADLHGDEVREWVHDRVAYARACFAVGRTYLDQVGSVRCRLAGHAYVARFEWVLDAVERDAYRLRAGYPERATLRGGVSVAARGLRSALVGRRVSTTPSGSAAGPRVSVP